MLNDKVNIKKLAKLFHENSYEEGFHLYELESLYKEIFKLRLKQFMLDFKKITDNLNRSLDIHIGEWKISCTKTDLFPDTDPNKAFLRMLKASRSSQNVEHMIFFHDITKEFNFERNEMGKKTYFKINCLNPSINFTQYQDFALVGSWFYRLKNEIETEIAD